MADKNKKGRPTKYDPRLCSQIIEYFDVEPYEEVDGKRIPNPLPTFEKFAHSVGLCVATLHVWKGNNQDFLEAYKKAQELQKHFWITNSLLGLYPPGFACFAGKNMFEWRDKQDINHSGDISITISDGDDSCL
jgi:hypothetical protein